MGNGDALCTPCGGCRQKLREFAQDDVKIHCCTEDGVLIRTFTLDELLPFSFGPENLDERARQATGSRAAEDGHHPRLEPRLHRRCGGGPAGHSLCASLPGFPVPKISGHAGKLVVGKLGGKEVAVLAGRAHPYESGNAAVMRPVIETLKGAGIETLILTNAAGSLKPEMRPGSIMLITDHINYSGMNPLIGQHGDENFVPMTDAYDPALRERLLRGGQGRGALHLHQGVYCWYSGPCFETPAEIRMFQIVGGTAVGMSTVPETILARRFGLRWRPSRSSPISPPGSRAPRPATRKPSARAPRRPTT